MIPSSKQISSYFRQSLIDSDRLCPEDKDILSVLGPDKKQDSEANYVAVSSVIWHQGRIDSNLAEEIIEARQPKNKPPLQQLEIVIFPRVDFLKCQGGDRDQRKRKVMLPLVVFVNLQRDGSLLPTSKAPWIPRIWVGPSQSATQPFTEMGLLDDFFTHYPFEGIEKWSQLNAYCTRLLCSAIGDSYHEASELGTSTQLNELAISHDYEMSDECLLQLAPPVVGAKTSMLKVLDFLIEKGLFPKLYKTYSNRNESKLIKYRDKQEDFGLAKRHVGQMSGEFPLSVKQRNALHHFFGQKAGEILAVNGPPGTGKTTLLRSVVANLWTQAALKQGEPPLIVATSNNNQAVTNILESFARIDETGLDERLIGRWLPEVDSYGLYFCASGKANQNNLYRYAGPKGEGCMEEWQTQTFVTNAHQYFLTKVELWQQSECKSVDDALAALHKEMCSTQQKIKQGFDYLEAWQSAQRIIEQQYGSVDSLKASIAEFKSLYSERAQAYKQEKALLDAVYELWESRKWWVTLLMWVPVIRKQQSRKTARLLNQWDKILEASSDDEVEEALNQQIKAIRNGMDHLQLKLSEAEDSLSHYQLHRDNLDNWLAPAEEFELFSKTIPEQVSELNDRYYRFHLFKLATHYFEGRWLNETKSFVENNGKDRKSPFKLLRKLRRYAKLTPCFVSTFYMVPTTFMAGETKDDCWVELPQLEEIDLLIVDEAGQALPDISAASFALAKKALVVGDTDQIEPVWSIPASVDRANLALFDLLKDEQDYEQWLESGMLASSGSVMRLGQRQCHHHQFDQLQRGLYLTEHRRCFNEIVSYCNDLVYQGVLEPLRGNAKSKVPWGSMALQTVYSPSQSFGGSRGNPGEAESIAQWLLGEHQALLAYARQQDKEYQTMDDAEVLRRAVGIITPFSKQAGLIRTELSKVGIEGLTVGTVHSLQGDERLIILFSSVYGENNKDSGKFYDSGPNMLNVAVSRAKDAFIVFGDPNVFGVNVAGSPSGLLRQRLVVTEEIIGSETVS